MPYGKGSYSSNNGGKKGLPGNAGTIRIMPQNEGTSQVAVGKKSVKNNKHGRNVSIGKS